MLPYLLIELLRFEIPAALIELQLWMLDERVISQQLFTIGCTTVLLASALGRAAMREAERRIEQQRKDAQRQLAAQRRSAARRKTMVPKAAKNTSHTSHSPHP